MQFIFKIINNWKKVNKLKNRMFLNILQLNHGQINIERQNHLFLCLQNDSHFITKIKVKKGLQNNVNLSHIETFVLEQLIIFKQVIQFLKVVCHTLDIK